MLIPRRVKHRKQHHPKRDGMAKGGTELAFGEYGLQAVTPAYVTNRQIESARISITRHIKRGGRGGRKPQQQSAAAEAPKAEAAAAAPAETPGTEA